MIPIRIGSTVTLLLLGGCTPSVPYLVATRQYDEAVCATTRFGDEAAETLRVRSALSRDAAPSLHIHAVTDEELGQAFGRGGERLNDQALLLRVLTETNQVSVGGFYLDVLLLSQGRTWRAGSGHPALARATGEALPRLRRHSIAPSFADRVALAISSGDSRGLASGIGELATLRVLPSPEAPGHVEGLYGETIQATDADHPRPRPVADALAAAGVSAWERPPPASEVQLVIQWSYTSHSYDGLCQLVDEIVIELPAGPTLEARINRLFGSRMRRLAELRASKGHG